MLDWLIVVTVVSVVVGFIFHRVHLVYHKKEGTHSRCFGWGDHPRFSRASLIICAIPVLIAIFSPVFLEYRKFLDATAYVKVDGRPGKYEKIVFAVWDPPGANRTLNVPSDMGYTLEHSVDFTVRKGNGIRVLRVLYQWNYDQRPEVYESLDVGNHESEKNRRMKTVLDFALRNEELIRWRLAETDTQSVEGRKKFDEEIRTLTKCELRDRGVEFSIWGWSVHEY